MIKKWFQHSEVMAGTKRLILSFYIYKFIGESALRIIAFFVILGAYISAKERRECSFEYFKILEEYSNKKYPQPLSSFKQFFNYGNSLVDKIVSFSGNLTVDRFKFIDGKETLFDCINNKEGIFILTTHIGNIEILRSVLQSDMYPTPSKINIFLEKKSCEIFNSFLEKVKINSDNITSYAVEEVQISTAIELSEKLENGEIIFMAGDRISADNPEKFYTTNLLNRKINLPIGALKLAQMLNTNIFFIICVKNGKYHNVISQKFIPNSKNKKEILEQLKKEYTEFLEKYTQEYPYQFYNFYNIFN